MRILIARSQDNDYKRYVGYGWGRERGKEIILEPKQSHKYKAATILWNDKPRVLHLNEDVARKVLAGRITAEYAFPEPGVYFIKGLSYFSYRKGENEAPIESDPIKIVVTEPIGDDLEVWNRIKGNREIALLMQDGEFDTSEEQEKEQLINEVEQILTQYPNSTYSQYLRQNLKKFKAAEERRSSWRK